MDVHTKVLTTRANQGLPPTIQDPATLERIAAIFRLAAPAEPVALVPKRRRRQPTPARD